MSSGIAAKARSSAKSEFLHHFVRCMNHAPEHFNVLHMYLHMLGMSLEKRLMIYVSSNLVASRAFESAISTRGTSMHG